MSINKENKDYKINSYNTQYIIIVSTFAILLLYLSNTFLFDNMEQIWADNYVIASIPVGYNPCGVAYDPDDGRVYVANEGSSSVSVIATSQYPHHTTITSAVDGNNNPVQNKSSTLSTL